MRKFWVIDCLYASTFIVFFNGDSQLYALTNFEKSNHLLIIILIAYVQYTKETCQ
ncbi:hypothetical protein [Staphylococcus argenteus]|uniref:hypothetical protein n=1 Tax=Staphylococcus argenteus TaxID=985002 RepID=UPI0005A65A19|nr:hypothetical protein [Staphylococcus argenteus]